MTDTTPAPSHLETETDAPDDDRIDVVTGPVGSARLVEPSTADDLGADLDAHPTIDADDGPAG